MAAKGGYRFKLTRLPRKIKQLSKSMSVNKRAKVLDVPKQPVVAMVLFKLTTVRIQIVRLIIKL